MAEAGVRSIRNVVENRMSKRLRHNLLLAKRPIQLGSTVRFFTEASGSDEKINYVPDGSSTHETSEEEDSSEDAEKEVL